MDETSAGGLVLDRLRGAAAIIGRLDRRGRLLWSLPKGHIEAGETAEQTAVREVAEETGIHSRVLRPLGSIDYWFVAEDRRVHKTVHHFLLEALGGELSDEDVEVTEVAWVPLGELDERLAYADERRLVRRAVDLLAGSELPDLVTAARTEASASREMIDSGAGGHAAEDGAERA
ncbi:NADH pyrophosphatase [Actinosynnema sp. ALI-1.44]